MSKYTPKQWNLQDILAASPHGFANGEKELFYRVTDVDPILKPLAGIDDIKLFMTKLRGLSCLYWKQGDCEGNGTDFICVRCQAVAAFKKEKD